MPFEEEPVETPAVMKTMTRKTAAGRNAGGEGPSGKRLPSLPVLFLALILPAAFCPSCGKRGEDDGSVILEVDGVPVFLEEFQRELDFELTWRRIVPEGAPGEPGTLTRRELEAKIVNEMLIPFAAVRARFKDEIPALLDKARRIRREVRKDRSNFGDLAARYAAPPTAASRGRLGFFARSGGLPYPLERRAFAMKPGALSEPFLSLVGCHVLHVERFVKGVTAAQDRVEAEQILLAYDDDPVFLQKTLPGIVSRARVVVVDPAFADLAARGVLSGAARNGGRDPSVKGLKDERGEEREK